MTQVKYPVITREHNLVFRAKSLSHLGSAYVNLSQAKITIPSNFSSLILGTNRDIHLTQHLLCYHFSNTQVFHQSQIDKTMKNEIAKHFFCTNLLTYLLDLKD
ncbi:hypothetical protein EUGRSUZ_K03292 [Eucalyptus grandis]|uniref:Uncharacterized protein n=2 Tax=Eucalyptus grandis TaxID=71139 RepID=A0ACC3J171_EUCGR|nr:hypothetical protein EUGRSUZ_K03292 [Eucalyptus grandis]